MIWKNDKQNVENKRKSFNMNFWTFFGTFFIPDILKLFSESSDAEA